MDPKTKLKILRQYESNPSLALVNGLEEVYSILSKELKDQIDQLYGKLPDMVKLAHIEKLKGDKGDAPSKDEIVKELLPIVKKYVPKDGHTPTTSELLYIIKPLIPRVKDGKTPTDKEIAIVVKRILKPIMESFKASVQSQDKTMDKIEKPREEETPDKIVSKINETENAIDMKTIKGFTTLIGNLQRAIREATREKGGGGKAGGGGMGNWIHEQFSVGDSQASVTLKSNVAASGTAMLLRYQGQMLSLGVQYTISANVVTLLFTTVSGNTIDATYVRSS